MIQLSKEPELETYFTPAEPGIKTNIMDLDEFAGGLRLGKLYIVSAPSGMGKTTFMVGCMTQAALENPNKKFLYIATEQDAREIKAKILANVTGINSYRFTIGDIKEEEQDLVAQAEAKLSNVYFEYYDNIDFNLKKCLDDAREVGVQYVFYDYLGAISDLDDPREWNTLIQLADNIKRYAVENNIFIMSATQCNRNIREMKEIPALFDEGNIAKSKGIANKADAGFILYRATDKGDCFLDMYKNRDMPDHKRLLAKIDYTNNRIF